MKKSHKNREHDGKKGTEEHKKKYEFEVEEMEERIAPNVTNFSDKENQETGGPFWR